MNNATEILLIGGQFIMGCLISLIGLPYLIRYAKSKELLDYPNWRSAHKEPIPSIGGLSFIPILIVGAVFVAGDESFGLLFGIIAMGALGFWDDRIDLGPRIKFLVQFIVALVLYLSGFKIESLHGVFGIQELNELSSGVFTVILIVGIINAYNLIDGIDGLAGGLGAIGSLFFGVMFLLNGDFAMSILAFGLAGTLLGFLRHNFHPAKVFMGDVGSLLLGTMMAVFFLKGFSYARSIEATTSLAIVIIPCLDMARLFLSRAVKGISPFKADKNHYHHLLIKAGDSHLKASLTTYVLAVAFLSLAFMMSSIFSLAVSCYLMILLGLFMYSIVEFKFFFGERRMELKAKRKLNKEIAENNLLNQLP